MKILVACEYSGVVRDAFRRLGHDAWSCDILPCESDPAFHYQCDVLTLLDKGWDMMIAHPPCTDLAVSGASHFKEKRADGRQQRAIDFFMELANADIPKIAVENPVCIISSIWRKPDQIIQPFQFGHPESKKTCLWLKNLPLLVPTDYAEFKNYRCKCGRIFHAEDGKYGCCEAAAVPLWDNQTKSGQNKLAPSKDRWKIRSKTYQGIADAMAEQWGTENPNLLHQ